MAKTTKKAAKKVVKAQVSKDLNAAELAAMEALTNAAVDLNTTVKLLQAKLATPPMVYANSYFETPPQGPGTDIANSHVDERGRIDNIVSQSVGSVAVITSKANTTRAKHWHREDAHLCFVISGKIQYFERAQGSEATPRKYTFVTGDAFFTGPMVEHEMFFPEDTVFLTLGNRSREQADYEKDLVRLPTSLRDLYIRVTGEA